MYFCMQCSQFFWEDDARFCPACGKPLREGIAVDVKASDAADSASLARWLFDQLRELWPDMHTRIGEDQRVGTLYIFDQTILLSLRPRLDAEKFKKELERRRAEHAKSGS